MEKRLLLCLLCVVSVAFSLEARQRTEAEALRIARSFYEGQGMLRSAPGSDFRLVYTGEGSGLRSVSSDPYYYIYNVGEGDGFVMVSGDDRVAPVLGYSLSGSFDPGDMPSNMRGWFEEYERQIDHAHTQLEQVFPENVSSPRSDDGFPERVEPLIQTKWDQGAPYNSLCPLDGDKRSATGCVATAAVQIMNYHQWPEKAVGKGQYRMGEENVNETVFSVDLSGYTFDWKNMLDVYDSTSTAVQDKAVAELMYAVGVAGNMLYSAAGSGTMDEYMAKGLIENLNYDKNLLCLHRDYYMTAGWKRLLKVELAAKRPVLYGGTSTSGGHAFVCDGYDKDGLFHINWGWGGAANGFFELDVLNPYIKTYSGFSYGQDMIIGFQKPTEASEPYLSLNVNSVNVDRPSISQGDSLGIEYALQLDASSEKELELALGVFTGDSLSKIVYEEKGVISPVVVSPSFLWKTDPLCLDPGLYGLRALYRVSGEKEWRELTPSRVRNNEIHLLATDSLIEVISYADEYTGTHSVYSEESLVVDGSNVLCTVIRNESAYERNPMIVFMAHSLSTGEYTDLSIEGAYFQSGEEKEVRTQIKVNLSPGRYVLAAYSVVSDGLYFIKGTEVFVTVEGVPTGIHPLAVDDKLRVLAGEGRLSVSFTSPLHEAYLYDVSGRLCSTGVMNGTGSVLSTAGLSGGIYVLKVRIEQGWAEKKIVL